jgi:hypothetical protein
LPHPHQYLRTLLDTVEPLCNLESFVKYFR